MAPAACDNLKADGSRMDLYFPVPHDWQAFERLVQSIAEFRYPDGSVQLYGRQGQSQGGIDVLVDLHGTSIGIQCKHYVAGLKWAALTKECDTAQEHFSAANSRQGLTTFIAATTAQRDTALQDKLVKLNASSTYTFQVRVWFWEDINDVLNRSVVAAARYHQSIMRALLPAIVDDHKSVLAQAFGRHAFVDGFADGEGDVATFCKRWRTQERS
jgi:predicted GNAT superfamily acetyltransferase